MQIKTKNKKTYAILKLFLLLFRVVGELEIRLVFGLDFGNIQLCDKM